MKKLTLGIGLALLGALGCNGKTAVHMTSGSGNGDGTPPSLQGVGGTGGNGSGAASTACATGRSYVGFGGTDLTIDRLSMPLGQDRDRQKPFSALSGEFPRVLGNTPGLLSTMGPTFADPPVRWYQEAHANAVSIYSAFRIAYQGCQTITGSGSTFNTAPDGNSAPAQCLAWETAFWSRTPNNDEVAACSEYAVNETANASTPQLQWAYACASVLTASQFMSF